MVESLGHDQYRVRVDGSGRLTLRNRRFLRSYAPAAPYTRRQPAALLPLPMALVDQPMPARPEPVTPQGPIQRAPDGPRDTDLATFLPVPPGGASSGLGARDVPVPVGVTPVASLPPPRSPPLLPRLGQPCRARRPPRRYEPETGLWVQD